MTDVINIAEKFSQIKECWQPGIVGELNGQYVKLAKLKGEFVWHTHEHEDELFLIVKGSLVIRMEDGDRVLNEGEMCVIPKGTPHLPIAEEECQVLLFEPKNTVNTGVEGGERTYEPQWM